MTTFKDISGQILAGNTVIKFSENRGGKSYWICECPNCHSHYEKDGQSLRAADKKGKKTFCSLECYHRYEASDRVGKTFNFLTVDSINQELTTLNKIVIVDTTCACGAKKPFILTKVATGKIKACTSTCKNVKEYEKEIGKVYGKLTVTGAVFPKETGKYAEKILFKCLCECGNTHEAPPSKIKHGMVTSCGCNAKEYQKSIVKNKNPNWKNGATEEVQSARTSKEYISWRSQVMTRDNFTCYKCGHHGTGGTGLAAHHFYNFSSYKSLRYNLNNGKTLCTSCHTDFHSKYGRCWNTPTQFLEFMESKDIKDIDLEELYSEAALATTEEEFELDPEETEIEE